MVAHSVGFAAGSPPGFVEAEGWLHEAAVRAVGFDDFGEEPYLEGLRALLDSYDRESKLGDDGLSRHFGIPNREAIARGDGFAALALESSDIAADVADFAQTGIGISGALPFSRGARLPDGTETTVGFSLAFVRDDLSPQTSFFTCQQLNPQAFWNPAFQAHPNGVRHVAGAVLVADNPADHHIFLSAFTGERVLHSSSLGIEARTPRGSVEIMEPVAFEDQFGIARKAAGTSVSITGMRFVVADLAATEHEVLFDVLRIELEVLGDARIAHEAQRVATRAVVEEQARAALHRGDVVEPDVGRREAAFFGRVRDADADQAGHEQGCNLAEHRGPRSVGRGLSHAWSPVPAPAWSSRSRTSCRPR